MPRCRRFDRRTAQSTRQEGFRGTQVLRFSDTLRDDQSLLVQEGRSGNFALEHLQMKIVGGLARR
jgi:hypothetical protein